MLTRDRRSDEPAGPMWNIDALRPVDACRERPPAEDETGDERTILRFATVRAAEPIEEDETILAYRSEEPAEDSRQILSDSTIVLRQEPSSAKRSASQRDRRGHRACVPAGWSPTGSSRRRVESLLDKWERV